MQFLILPHTAFSHLSGASCFSRLISAPVSLKGAHTGSNGCMHTCVHMCTHTHTHSHALHYSSSKPFTLSRNTASVFSQMVILLFESLALPLPFTTVVTLTRLLSLMPPLPGSFHRPPRSCYTPFLCVLGSSTAPRGWSVAMGG